MAFSLYSAVVPSFRQILEAVSGLLGKAERFCTEKGLGVCPSNRSAKLLAAKFSRIIQHGEDLS